MKHHGQFSLVKGTFEPNAAADVLFRLINDKINYHQHLLFSNEERYGADLANSRIRIAELEQMRDEIAEVIRQAREEGVHLDILSDIRITKAETVQEHS